MSAPAATIAAQRVAEVRDSPQGRLELLRSSYAPLPGAAPLHLRYRRTAFAFMTYAWDPLDSEPWAPPATRLVRVVRRALPPPRRFAIPNGG